MPKRGSERQITQDNYHEEEEEGGEIGYGIKRASEKQMSTRRFVKPRYPATSSSSSASKNPFSNVQFAAPSKSTTPFASSSSPSSLGLPRDSLEPAEMSNEELATKYTVELNDLYIPYILDVIAKNPSKDMSQACWEYNRYAKSILRLRNGTSVSAASAAVPVKSVWAPSSGTGAAATSSKPGFSFQQPSATAPADAPSPAPKAPAFSFGQSPAAALGFTFGQPQAAGPVAGSPFSFGKSPAAAPATAPSFSFGKSPAASAPDTAAPANDNDDAPAGDQEGEEEEDSGAPLQAADGDYESVFRVDPVKRWTNVDGKLELFKGKQSLSIEKHKTDGTFICVMRVAFTPTLTFRVNRGMEFDTIRRKDKKGATKTSLRFQAVAAENDKALTYEIRVAEANFGALVKALRTHCNAVVKGTD